MTKKALCLILGLLLVCSLAVPAMAASPDPGMTYISDMAGLLTDDQWRSLEAKAAEISNTYGCAIFAVTVADYRDYSFSPEELCGQIGRDYGQDCIVLLLSMAERDYALRDFGSLPAQGFTEYGFDTLEDAFLDDFGGDDWYGGFHDYLDQAQVLLQAAQTGAPLDTPLGERILTAYGIALLVGLIVAVTVCSIFKSQMKTAVKAAAAAEYVAPAGVTFQVRQDIYTHTTRTQRKIETNTSRSGGGGGNHSRSGKF